MGYILNIGYVEEVVDAQDLNVKLIWKGDKRILYIFTKNKTYKK